MRSWKIGLFVAALWAAGCTSGAPGTAEWPSIARTGERDVEVYVADDLRLEGERVDIFALPCRTVASAGGVPYSSCRRQYLGQGRVVAVIDDDHAVVRLPPGAALEGSPRLELQRAP